MRPVSYVLVPDKVLEAVLLGAAVAGGISAIPFLLAGPLVVTGFIFTTVCWMLGVMFLGTPVWWGLHRLRLATPEAFFIAGAITPALGILPILQPWRWGFSLWVACAVIFGAIGGLAGVLMHGRAYRMGSLAEVFS